MYSALIQQLAIRMKVDYNTQVKKRRFRAKALFALLFAAVMLALALFLLIRRADESYETMGQSAAPTLVIDAGHGGIDGGAISEDGTKESDLNLAIALRLESIVRFCGQKTVMTRWDDSSKTDMIGYSERKDLQRRADLANGIPGAVLISIHQDYYPTAQPRGAQVLYSGYQGSDRLGTAIQANLIGQLDPQNRRLAIPAPKELYLTANTRCPAVLVECGFMSNNFEVLNLKDSGYQTKLALTIAASYLSFLGSESKT